MSALTIIACFVGGGVLAALVYEFLYERPMLRKRRDRVEDEMQRRLESGEEL